MIQCRNGKPLQVVGFNMEQVNRWQWRPDYEGIHLAQCRSAGDLDPCSLPEKHVVFLSLC